MLCWCSYGWYFTFVQGFVYLFLIYLQGFTAKQMVNPWKTYVKLSAVLMGSHGLTKGSLAFLNYPAQLMFKSTKVNFAIFGKFGLFYMQWNFVCLGIHVENQLGLCVLMFQMSIDDLVEKCSGRFLGLNFYVD